MKNLLAIPLLLATFVSSSPCQDMSLHVAGGLSIPSTPGGFSRNFDFGPNGSLGFGYLVFPSVLLVASVDYSRFPLDDDGLIHIHSLSGTISGGGCSVVAVTMNARLKMKPTPKSICPYLIVGLGAEHLSTSEVTEGGVVIVNAISEIAFTIQGGGGINFPLSEALSVFLEGRYSVAFTQKFNDKEATGFWPVSVGLQISL